MLGFIRNGKRIVKIYEDSPAGRNDKIRVGDEIIAINHKEILNARDISGLLRNSGSSVIITFGRNGNAIFTWITFVLLIFIIHTIVIIISKLLLLITLWLPVELENEQRDLMKGLNHDEQAPYDADVVEARYSRTYKVQIPGIKWITGIILQYS